MGGTVDRHGGSDFDGVGVMCGVVYGFDDFLLCGAGHEGGFDAVAVSVVFVGGNDVVVYGVGLGAGVRLADGLDQFLFRSCCKTVADLISFWRTVKVNLATVRAISS